jgi:non-ribosomal peptide synthetase component F
MLVSRRTTAALEALSREERVTLFITLMASFLALIRRRIGGDDILIGTDVANRTRVETEPLIGFFVNLLPIRADVSGNPTFDVARTCSSNVSSEHMRIKICRSTDWSRN